MKVFVRIAVAGCLLGGGLVAATPPAVMTPSQASARVPGTFLPVHADKRILLRGTVAGPVVRLQAYSHAVVQSEGGVGITLDAPRQMLDPLSAGDEVEVLGVIGERAGLPVLRPERITTLGEATAVPPQQFRVADLLDHANLGRYITTEGEVLGNGSNAGGDVLVIGTEEQNVTIFLARERHSRPSLLESHERGDRVRVTGLSSQYCPAPPFDRGFQILIGDPGAVTLVSRGWMISPAVLFYVMFGLGLAGGLWWRREHLLSRRRAFLQAVMNLSEDVISASSPKEILRRLQLDLPRAIGADTVEVFVYNRTNDRLERIPSESSPQPFSVSIDEPIGSFYSTVSVCFRNRTLLDVPDTRRSPMFSESDSQAPASAVFVPMMAQRDLLGVLAGYYRKPAKKSTPERQTALQHLANQIAASLKLQEQQQMREQLLRSEKLAAAGQLISGVANDLRAPLENVSRTARALLAARNNGGSELREIAADAERGLDVVSHLLAFARMERTEARPVDIYALVNTLLDVRDEDRKRKGVTVESKLPLSPLEVLADQAQLEQAFLSMLVQAEHAASLSAEKRIRVTSRIVGKKVLVVLEASMPAAADPVVSTSDDTDYFGLPVAQAILQSLGGEIRCITGPKEYRLELELPVHLPSPAIEKPSLSTQNPVRVLTAVIIEPDGAAQRRLLAMLAARGHRAIPTGSAEHAADLVQRMTFDVVFCAVRLPGLNWVELFQRVRRRVGAFALMTDGYDAEAARAFRAGEGYVLAKPLDEQELQEFLAMVEVRQAATRR